MNRARVARLLPLLLVAAGAGACAGCEEPVRCSTTDFCPDGTSCEDEVCVPTDTLPIDPGLDGSPDHSADPDGADADDTGGNVDDGDDDDGGATSPTDPTSPGDPTAPSDPTEPGEPTSPTDPTSPGDPTTPAEPDEPAAPACQPTAERCSFVDESCDGRNNEGLDCTFVAASNDALWSVDPFAGVVTRLGGVTRIGAEVLFDIDTAPDGTLLATAGRSLYRVNGDGTLTAMGSWRLPFNPNGLAVDADGTVFVTNHDRLVGSKVVSSSSPDVEPTHFTSLGELDSSGDCVRHKTRLLLTVVGTGGDRLTVVDLQTREVSVVGDLGFVGVMGLSSAFGELFGVTGTGEVLRIDDETGDTELLFTTPDVRFTGASSRR
jgi:hypothetical protein